MLVLKFDFHEGLLLAKVEDCSFERRLDKPFHSPGIAHLDIFLVDDPGAGTVEHSCNLFLSFGPIKSKWRIDLPRVSVLTVRKADKSRQQQKNPDAKRPHICR